MTPAVVVIAFNRPGALRRLLASLSKAHCPAGVAVPLVISIDRGANGRIDVEVAAIARDYDWPHGPKQVIEQAAHLGVVGHFRAAGGLTRAHEGVVILEDDLVVAPAFYEFAAQALARYEHDERLAAVCLYGLWFNGFTQEPFEPVADGNDVFFLRLPYTQGLAFTRAQWQRYEAADQHVGAHPDLHPAFLRFGRDEWFPALAHSLASTGRYVCFPRVSLTTGWGDAGAHFEEGSGWFQASLQLGAIDYRLPALDEALAVYDGFFELLPDRLRRLGVDLPAADCDLDLNATKSRANLKHDLVLTTRPVRHALANHGLTMRPPELNLVYGVAGEAIPLARRDDVYWDRIAGLEARHRLHDYAWSRLRPSRRRSLLFAVARRLQAWRQRRDSR